MVKGFKKFKQGPIPFLDGIRQRLHALNSHPLFIGAMVIFVASIANVFFMHLPGLQLALSVVFAFISGGIIMFQTNMIVHGGERNYINATVTLYVSLFNIFITLLQIFGMFGGNRN